MNVLKIPKKLNPLIMSVKKCYLRNVSTNHTINIPHEQIKILGRNPETQCEDTFVSRDQLKCMANTETGELSVIPIGRAISGIDGYAVTKDRTYTIGHGHRIELRFGFHVFEVVFEPPPETEEIEPPSKKPKIDFPLFNTKKEVDVKPTSFSENGKWEDIGNKELLIYTPENMQGRSKIAAFDVDGTIIKTKSGSRFPKDGDDWVLNFNSIPQRFKNLNEEGFKIVFFTNQSGVGRDSSKIKDFKQKIKDFKRKIENVLKKIGVPIQVFISLGRGVYRKPAPGMWNTLKTVKNDSVDIDVEKSFYVGDAAGREKNWAPNRTKDHSLADRLFALNIGLTFYTPEEYFQKTKPVRYAMPEFDPRSLAASQYPVVDFDTPNVILMVGGPGSGKSHFCRTVLLPKGYKHINRDKLGSWQKCVKVLEEHLQQGKNCVIDNTNPDKESRARYIEVANRYKVACRCLVMSTDFQQTKHNNKFREMTDSSHIPVSDIIINGYKKKFEAPEVAEGFEAVIKVPFVAKFTSDENERLYKMFLLEK